MKMGNGELLVPQTTPHLGGIVFLRDGTVDRQVWADTFTGLYHVPPERFSPATVLDLGANVGLVAAHYRFFWPDAKIVAVEIDAENAELARLNAPTVTVLCEAVAGEAGRVSYDRGVRSDSYRIDPFSSSGLADAETLQGIILREFGTGGVDFVKMDVEGAEWKILERTEEWSPLVRRLLVELHGDSTSDTLVEVATTLLMNDFTVTRHERHPQAVYAVR